MPDEVPTGEETPVETKEETPVETKEETPVETKEEMPEGGDGFPTAAAARSGR